MRTAGYTPEELHALRSTLLDEQWRLDNLYKIQTKDSRLVTLRMNRPQRTVHERTKTSRRTVILKSRQVGISTYFLLKYLDKVLFTPHTTAAIIAHDVDTTNLLFEIVQRAYENIPPVKFSDRVKPWLKPEADRKTLRMLKFNEIDSKIYVDQSIRGGTVHALHVSEAAFIERMDEVWAATQESVPAQTGIISVESTANGQGNWFWNTWYNGDGWDKVFFGWHEYEDNRIRELDPLVPGGPMERFAPSIVAESLTQDEMQQRASYDLDFEQLAWYRYKKSLYGEGAQHLFKQENPATADEAFVFAQGRFYPEFSPDIHVVPDHEPPTGVNKFVSMDYGWTNPTSIGLWYVDYDGNCVRYREAYRPHWLIADQAKWLRAQGFDTVHFCDPSMFANNQQKNGKQESYADEYRRHGIQLRRANNDKGAGFPRVREYLRVRDGHRNPLTGYSPAPTVYCAASCKDSIREFMNIRHARRPTERAINQELREDHEKTGELSHATDDWRYFLVSRPRLPTREEEMPTPGTPAYRIWLMEKGDRESGLGGDGEAY